MTMTLFETVCEAGEDFEWYPTTQRMIEVVSRHIPKEAGSIMDIGAGDGRVLAALARKCERAELYAIEKSLVLLQAQPETVTPVGTDFHQQDLTCLPADYIFCNPPYSEFEEWAARIIESGHAEHAFLIVPRRWTESTRIKEAIKWRGARTRVIHQDDFQDAERRARAVVDVVQVTYPKDDGYYQKPLDPFDQWFEQNIHTFDQEEELSDYQVEEKEIAKIRHLKTIDDMVASFNEEHARMEENYRAIFKMDYALLKELGVTKDAVRDGIKKKMAGLKHRYWSLLFDQLDTITSRLATETKKNFLGRLTGRTAIAFTAPNAYSVILWAVKHANKYYDEQLIKLFRDLSTHDGVMNYKSNQRTWQKDGWRYGQREHVNSHYALDYRIVVHHYSAIGNGDYRFEHPNGLHKSCHELIADVVAVLGNLGFLTSGRSLQRQWEAGEWQDFCLDDGSVLFQVKAFKNGNLHWRFMPKAIKAINVEAGRLLGWLRGPTDVVNELGYTSKDAEELFGSSHQLVASNVKLLEAAA